MAAEVEAIDKDTAYVADFNLSADRDVALEIRSRTNSNEPIFVWGFEPAIYWFAERPPSSRFIYDVAQRTEWQRGYARAELLRDLHTRPPSLIVVQHNDVFPAVTGHAWDSHDELPGFPELAGFIDNGYVYLKRIEDFDIYQRGTAPLQTSELFVTPPQVSGPRPQNAAALLDSTLSCGLLRRFAG